MKKTKNEEHPCRRSVNISYYQSGSVMITVEYDSPVIPIIAALPSSRTPKFRFNVVSAESKIGYLKVSGGPFGSAERAEQWLAALEEKLTEAISFCRDFRLAMKMKH